eukprot:CAMPEP_0197908364 /NCGR_PEP_ID=MMETSP1439-20131203/66725_1 /TAXON_ID=66791 /ORGANISM="Gonyaulax spinifera, Strain CCMP409" /LENGTH=97 /DNA_ID=CAMNT_0043529855 /DNA_START=11 /DNA_END=304 /DNA_ORIENTATION=+
MASFGRGSGNAWRATAEAVTSSCAPAKPPPWRCARRAGLPDAAKASCCGTAGDTAARSRQSTATARTMAQRAGRRAAIAAGSGPLGGGAAQGCQTMP